MPENPEIIENYEKVELIAETHKSSVYRARNLQTNQTFILKTFKKKYPSYWELAQIRQEEKLLQSLKHSGIVRSLGLVWQDNTISIALEDTHGVSLKNFLSKNFISISSFLELAIRLVDALAYVHSRGVIHKDIKPQNIIVRYSGNEFQDIRLTDFGLSVIQGEEIQSIYNPKVIEGTLPYISPEQSGRMNLGVDYRTDFYSLGITFYEILSGELPFFSSDPIELIHSHIARTPPAIRERQNQEIPEAILGIIHKLIAKSPEERYQNAIGLKRELEYCKENYDKKGSISNFQPGMLDVADRFIIPQKIIGRDVEIQTLLSAFERVRSGQRVMMLVLGSPGIGKSRLILEVQKPILKARGYFFSGKYDRMRKDVPFSSIIQSFQALIKQILTEPEERILIWKKKILEGIGQNGKVITQVIPELEYIIGEQPDVPSISSEEAFNRFNYTFLNFVKIFAKKEHPLTLFLDDLQWADLASINLLQVLLSEASLKYFFLICAYREEEVTEYHAFAKIIENVKRTDLEIEKIRLGALDKKNVHKFISHLMGENAKKTEELANILFSKTHGNPFFLTQFIKNLYDGKFLEYDNVNSVWYSDIEKIQELKVTDNVLELMTNRINTLPSESRRLLEMASCIGNRFTLETLSAIYGKNYEETLGVLEPLVREGYIINSREIYKFLHDRIQEASYSLVSEEERIALHTLIGYITLTDLKEGELNEKIFYITDQLNHGRKNLLFETDKENLAKLNLDAGLKAMVNAAYEPAYRYLKIGLDILKNFREDSWKTHYELSLALNLGFAEVCYLCAKFEELKEIFSSIELKANLVQDKLKMYEIEIKSHIAKNELKQAVDRGLDVLKSLGIRFPKNLHIVNTILVLLKFKFQLLFKNKKEFIDLPFLQDSQMESAFRIISSINSAAYWERPALLPFIIIKVASLSIIKGISTYTPYNFAGAGLIFASISDYKGAKEFGDMAIRLVEKHKIDGQYPRTHFVNNTFIRPWNENLRDVLESFEFNFQRSLEIGDIEFASHIGFVHSYFSYLAGVELEGLFGLTQKYLEATKKMKQNIDENMIALYFQIIHNLTERNSLQRELKGEFYNIEEKLPIHIQANDRTSLFHVYLNSLILNYLYGQMEEAYSFALQAGSALDGGVAVIATPVYYFYEALTCAQLHDEDPDKKKSYKKKLYDNRKKLQKLVSHSPKNFQHKWELLEAECYRIEGNFTKALEYYEKSIQNSRASYYIQEEAIACKRISDFFLVNGYKELAKPYINLARMNFQNWGASGLAKKIAVEYSDLIVIKPEIREDFHSHSLHSTTVSPNLDLNTILKFSHILSREIELKSLLDKILTLSIKSAGAEKGMLILEIKNKLFIEAVYHGPGEIELLMSIPIENFLNVPLQIINYVSKTRENVILSNAQISEQFGNDTYLSTNRIKSVLCSPILYKGKMSGILYLENNLATSVFTEERLELLAILSSQAAISIENARLLSAREDSVRLQKEMEITSSIQKSLIPFEPVSEGYTLGGYMKPAESVGGDYYDVINGENFDWAVIGDVSGHGILSGLIMMMVQTSIRLLISKEPNISPSELLQNIILGLDENIRKISRYQFKYMTITILQFDKEGNFFHCGQHQDMLIYRKNIKEVEFIPTEGVWIGMANIFQETAMKLINKKFHLEKGDLLLLYTDGITEGRDKNGLMLGVEGLAEILKTNSDLPLGQIKEKILESIHDYSSNDDITFLCIRRD